MTKLSDFLLVDIGERVTRIIPIMEDVVKIPLGKFLPRGGKFLSDYLSKMIYDRHYFVLKEEAIYDIKKNFCRLSLNRIGSKGPQLNQDDTINYIIPNTDSEIILDQELLLCPEAIFNPCLFDQDKEAIGLQDAIYNCIMNIPLIYRRRLFNIVVVGGSTMFPNFTKRLEQELKELAPVDMPINIIHSGNDGVWHSIAHEPLINQFIMTQEEEYIENYDVQWVKDGGLQCEDKYLHDGSSNF